MRLFFAISFPADVQQALEAHGSRICALLPGARFVRRELIHLTLHFLGEQSPTDATHLSQLLCGDDMALPAPFTARTTALGSFRAQRGHTLWMGLTPHPGFMQLYDNLLSLLLSAGYARPLSPFVPHITLARDATLTQPVAAYDALCRMPPLTVPVSALALYESMRDNGRLVYHSIASRRL